MIYRMLPVRVEFGGRVVDCHALLDCGSSLSFVDRHVADLLGVPQADTEVTVSWMDQRSRSVSCKEVSLNVQGDDRRWHALKCLATELSLPRQTLTMDELHELEIDVDVREAIDVKPNVLIGLDNGHLSRVIDCQISAYDGVGAVKTALGWTVEGCVSPASSGATVLLSHGAKLEKIVRDYINLDLFGIRYEEGEPRSVMDELALELMQSSVRRVGDRFECPLLWASDDRTFPDSRDMAMKRFLALEKKLKRDPVMAVRVLELMRSYMERGYVRVASNEHVEPSRCWYLPTFVVQNPAKPDKVRLVWDAAAKVQGVSLNDKLFAGPDLNEPLIYVLQRFRQGPLAVMGDITEMFHQITVPEEDRCALRFFWRNDAGELIVLEMCVMSFGATCSPAIAQFVKNLNAEQHHKDYPEAARSITINTYVDDWGASRWCSEDLMALTNDVVKVNAAAGLKMHKWMTNDPVLARFLDLDAEDEVGLKSMMDNKVLGMLWRVKHDQFKFQIDSQLLQMSRTYENRPRKKEVLSVVMSIFDPLGLISFVTVAPKLIMRETWNRGFEWEEQIPDECTATWSCWVQSLRWVEQLTFPRWFGTTNGPLDIHIFTDASERAMAAVAYIVQRQGETVVSCLAASKSKLAPMNSKSIPRQELEAFLLGVKLLEMVKKGVELPVKRVFLWTDAQDVLFWLTSTRKRFKPFIMARVNAIREATKPDNWRWVPSADNPADWATKTVDFGGDASLWANGPEFLREEDDKWPTWIRQPAASVNEEVQCVMTIKTAVQSVASRAAEVSRWRVLVRAVVRVKRFALLLRAKTKSNRDCLRSTDISEEEEHWAVLQIILSTQKDLCAADTKGLSPAKDEQGVVRMQSRINKASEVPFELRFPAILPRGHPVTKLVFQYHHHKMGHCCHNQTLLELRRKGFVCVGMKRQLNAVVKQCNTCVLRRAHPEQPEMGLLPRARVGVGLRPFTYTGADLFGPMEVLIGRRKERRWGVIFTCLTVRAVHLEVVHSLSCVSLCRAMDNLVNRRRIVPLEMRCDNGTNFVAASKTYVTRDGRRPTWRFNPPGSPHMGGPWERLVGSVKRAINNMKIRKTPDDEELRHLIVSAEGLLNARPLTEFPLDSRDQLPITPNDVLHGYEEVGVDAVQQRSVGEMTKQREANVLEFWRRFVFEYLPLIAARPKWHRKVEPLKIGQLVIIADTSVRSAWRRGVIHDVVLDNKTDQVRDVMVRTADGTIYRRGAGRVAPLRFVGDD